MSLGDECSSVLREISTPLVIARVGHGTFFRQRLYGYLIGIVDKYVLRGKTRPRKKNRKISLDLEGISY
jgi:hypothetical protein